MTSTGFGSQLSKSQFFHNYKGAVEAAEGEWCGQRVGREQAKRKEGVVAFTKHVPIPKIMCHAKRDRK